MKKQRKKKTLKRSEQVIFLSELAELLHAGYSLSLSLDVLRTSHPHWVDRLTDVQHELDTGKELKHVMGNLLSPTLTSYLALAQQHGRFEKTLALLAEKLRQLLTYQRQLRQVLTYPILLILILVGMAFLLEHTLYPVFSELTNTSSDGTADNFALTALHLLLGGALLTALICLLGYFYLLKQGPMKRMLFLARLPIVSSMTKDLVTAIMAEQLAIFLGAGLTLPEIIEHFAKEQIDKPTLSQALAERARLALAEGMELPNWLGQQVYLRAGIAAYLTRGFEPANLSVYLSHYAKQEFESFDQRIRRFFTLLQPVLFTLIGLTIILLYLAMLLPLYQNIGGYQA